MALTSGFPKRYWRAGFVLLGGWFVLEFALMKLVAARIGWEATLAFLSIKGGVGLVLMGIVAWRGLVAIRAGAGVQAAFGVVSAVLITLPGLALPLLGIALFTPSLQAAILKRLMRRREPQGPPRALDLDEAEWREIRRRKLPARRKSPKSIA